MLEIPENSVSIRYLQGFTTGAVGIEPTSMVLETTVLPLNYAPISVPGYLSSDTQIIIAHTDTISQVEIFLNLSKTAKIT